MAADGLIWKESSSRETLCCVWCMWTWRCFWWWHWYRFFWPYSMCLLHRGWIIWNCRHGRRLLSVDPGHWLLTCSCMPVCCTSCLICCGCSGSVVCFWLFSRRSTCVDFIFWEVFAVACFICWHIMCFLIFRMSCILPICWVLRLLCWPLWWR